MSIELVLLGNAQLLVDGQPIKLPSRAMHLLVYLAMMGPSPRDEVNRLIWHDKRDSARKRLEEFKRLVPGLLLYSRYTIQLGPDVEVDIPHIRDSLMVSLEKSEIRFCVAKAHYLYRDAIQQSLAPKLEFLNEDYQAWLSEQRHMWDDLRQKLEKEFGKLKARSNHPFIINENELLGLDEPIQFLLEWLYADNDYRTLRIEGIGGIGKTTLAEAFAQKVHQEHHFHLIWLDTQNLSLSAPPTKAFAFAVSESDEFVKKLMDSLGLSTKLSSPEMRLDTLRQKFSQEPTLVVIDNVDNRSEAESIWQFLKPLQGTGARFVLTSRLNLSTLMSESRRFLVEHLCEKDAVVLLQKSVPEEIELSVADAQKINKRIDGIPLALRLVGQLLSSMTVDEICQHLDDATSAEASQDMHINDMFRKIYEKIWSSQDETAKHVWVHIAETMNSGGVPLEILKETLANDGYSHLSILSACEKLASHYIITRGNNPNWIFYRMHHLTCQFIYGHFYEQMSASDA